MLADAVTKSASDPLPNALTPQRGDMAHALVRMMSRPQIFFQIIFEFISSPLLSPTHTHAHAFSSPGYHSRPFGFDQV